MTANGGYEGRETQPRPQAVDYDDKPAAADGAAGAPDPAADAAPATNGADSADPASAPQPDTDADTDTTQTAPAE